jgi:hypothetical protein
MLMTYLLLENHMSKLKILQEKMLTTTNTTLAIVAY